MGRFVLMLIIFIATALMAVGVLVHLLSNHLLQRTDLSVPAHHTMAVLGHSHAECAYNDSLITGLSNLAFSGETYFYTFYKVKLLLENNPQISTLFIECSNNQITEEMENWTWSTNSLGKRLHEFAMFMPVEDKWSLVRINPYGYLNAWSMLPSHYLKLIRQKEFMFFPRTGAFRYLTREKTDSILIARREHPEDHPPHWPFSDHNIRYLRQTIDLCVGRGCRVFLVRSPLHPAYENLLNEAEFLRTIENEFSDVPFIDMRSFPLTNDEFGDLEHLNGKGARKYSRFFQNMLDSGLLTVPDPSLLAQHMLDGYKLP
jgi:hypothetical protein